MTEPKPIACSLGASDLRRRLDEIAALGRDSLTAAQTRDGSHVLHFRSDEETHHRLAAIVTAESECCPFLDFDLRERDGALILTLVAPEDGRPVADELAAAFIAGSRRSPAHRSSGRLAVTAASSVRLAMLSLV
jgi:hypothetical protein